MAAALPLVVQQQVALPQREPARPALAPLAQVLLALASARGPWAQALRLAQARPGLACSAQEPPAAHSPVRWLAPARQLRTPLWPRMALVPRKESAVA